MRVQCPHCHKFHAVTVRDGNYRTEKANAARRRNAKLGGGPFKVSLAKVEQIFLGLPDPANCTGVQFIAAVAKATGSEYSRARAFGLLKKLKTRHPNPAGKIIAVRGTKVSDKLVHEPDAAPAKKTAKKIS